MQSQAATARPNYFAMLDSECPKCGAGTFGLARSCPDCGAPIRVRLAGMVVAGALVLLLAAIVTAIVVVLRGYQLAAATTTGAPADELVAAASTTDFSWLVTAMNGCEAEAKTDPSALHFFVTPLAAVDTAPWRAKSINDSGAGILLRADDTFDGLKGGSLRIFPADYAFSIADETSGQIYQWRPATGAAKFSTRNAAAVAMFRVEFRTAHGGGDAEYGTSFTRQAGSCYWVNVVFGN